MVWASTLMVSASCCQRRCHDPWTAPSGTRRGGVQVRRAHPRARDDKGPAELPRSVQKIGGLQIWMPQGTLGLKQGGPSLRSIKQNLKSVFLLHGGRRPQRLSSIRKLCMVDLVRSII